MSAPAINVRPPPINTTPRTDESLRAFSRQAMMPSGTPGLSALTGGLLIVMMAMPRSLLRVTSSLIELYPFGSKYSGPNHQESQFRRGASSAAALSVILYNNRPFPPQPLVVLRGIQIPKDACR